MRVGDKAVLACGGPPMSVVAVNDDLVTCAWFEMLPDGGWKGVQRATFPTAVLLAYTEHGESSGSAPTVEAN